MSINGQASAWPLDLASRLRNAPRRIDGTPTCWLHTILSNYACPKLTGQLRSAVVRLQKRDFELRKINSNFVFNGCDAVGLLGRLTAKDFD